MSPETKETNIKYIKRCYGIFLAMSKGSDNVTLITESANKLILALAEYKDDLVRYGA